MLLSAVRTRLADPAQRALLIQAARYAAAGLVITLLFSACFWLVTDVLHVNALVAHPIVFVVFSLISYMTHGRLSFEGHGDRDRQHVRVIRFLIVNLIGLAANQTFVFVLINQMQGPTWWPIIPFIFVTPWLTFALHRRWTYA
jgi:putative flippase GtrA